MPALQPTPVANPRIWAIPPVLRVVGRLPWLGVCRELGRQASENPSHKRSLVRRIERGFDFLRYRFGPEGLSVAKNTV
jgi:hypothetical protein